MRGGNHYRHGHTQKGHSPEYRAWCGIRNRCYRPATESYPLYGGRGIKVCDRWRGSFEAFLADVGLRPSSRHSLDRHPNTDGNYEPGNVRWATTKEQNQNRRNSVRLTFDGETRTLTEWAELYGLSYSRLQQRLFVEGCSLTDALTRPLIPRGSPLITFDSVTQSRAAWATALGIEEASLRWRLKHWPRERALTQRR